jgi:hypothetical protein
MSITRDATGLPSRRSLVYMGQNEQTLLAHLCCGVEKWLASRLGRFCASRRVEDSEDSGFLPTVKVNSCRG